MFCEVSGLMWKYVDIIRSVVIIMYVCRVMSGGVIVAMFGTNLCPMIDFLYTKNPLFICRRGVHINCMRYDHVYAMCILFMKVVWAFVETWWRVPIVSIRESRWCKLGCVVVSYLHVGH